MTGVSSQSALFLHVYVTTFFYRIYISYDHYRRQGWKAQQQPVEYCNAKFGVNG